MQKDTKTKRNLRYSVCWLSIAVCLCASLSVSARERSDQRQLFSPSVARIFQNMAHEITSIDNVSPQQAQEAIALLSAATGLQMRGDDVYPDMIRTISRYFDRDYSLKVYELLVAYADQYADLEIVREAIQYMLAQLNTREQREKILADMLKTIGGRNTVLRSELSTMLAMLMLEKADAQNAAPLLVQAYSENKYNRLAFAKLAEIMPDQINPAMYLENLRVMLAENPFDLTTALAFAQYAEQLQLYQTAAEAYEYCAELFGYLYPFQPLPSYIYLPWTINNYNTRRDQPKCLRIADELRQNGQFDIFVEAVAGKAALKIGDRQMADSILRATEKKALQMVAEKSDPDTPGPEQLAWFYSFALPEPEKAIEWANKAYSSEPNSVNAAAILAYALVANNQAQWAKPIIESCGQSQVALLALAQIQLQEGQKDAAVETLKSAIPKDPGSLAAERARQILREQGSEYITPIDPETALSLLRRKFAQDAVPAFARPEEMISVQLSARGSKFSYGRDFGGSVAITNISSQPLVISEDAAVTGQIRIDARITGDLTREIPNLITIKTTPASPIEPGRNILIPVQFVTGELRRILRTHPQASLEIQFIAFIDPVTAEENRTVNRLSTIAPATLVIKRPGVQITTQYLQNRLNSVSKGQQSQKIESARLFAGLLAEQNAVAGREPLYKLAYADWMPELLESALLHSLIDADWVTKVNTMAAMLDLPMNHRIVDAVAANLNDNAWPVRMMAVYLLAKSHGDHFKKVLDHTAEFDSSKYTRDMAFALGGDNPFEQELPKSAAPEAEQPDQPAPAAGAE